MGTEGLYLTYIIYRAGRIVKVRADNYHYRLASVPSFSFWTEAWSLTAARLLFGDYDYFVNFALWDRELSSQGAYGSSYD